MKTLVAVVQGFLSALMIYFAFGMLWLDVSSPESPSPAMAAFLLLGGWGLSAYILRSGAATVSKVFCRGFLLGAAEWLAMIPVSMVYASKAVASVGGSEPEASAGAALGGGIFTFLSGGLSIGMALLCMLCFAVAFFIGREMPKAAQEPTKKCPLCAETVKAEARKCRFCGADLMAPTAS